MRPEREGGLLDESITYVFSVKPGSYDSSNELGRRSHMWTVGAYTINLQIESLDGLSQNLS
jgi:hypothetical protein